MKAHLYDNIQTLIDVYLDSHQFCIPQGTQGTVIECYENPEGYAVDLAIKNDKLVGGYEYENVILFPEQFILIPQVNSSEQLQKTNY